ncbi:MAG: BMP family ABC transporter substrate-binding protein [Erysipelotrichaceae bacterium]|nr:BMP family ABC transporter substrate-binding protein [Erysipelotrichaceae bacterium]
MKNLLKALLAAGLVVGLTACSSGPATTEKEEEATEAAEEAVEETAEATEAAEDLKIAVLLPFTGDQSYFDTLARGCSVINSDVDGVSCDVVEVDPKGSADKALWMDAFAEYCEDGNYDLVVSGNNTYEAFLYEAAKEYPDQKFMNFDYSAAPETMPSNLYCVNYALDDLGYVVGTLSAKLTKSGKVGVVVGMDNQAMNQFISGYCQILAAEGVEYAIYYPGSFTDAALGKEGTTKMIEAGADVIWQVAGGLGNGVIEACSNYEDVWCVGVDQDQYAQFAESNPAWAETIITSALKKSDMVLVNAAKMLKDGSFDAKLGTAEAWGITMDGVGLAENDYYAENCSEEIRAAVAETLEAVKAGEVEVVDALEMADYEAEWPEVRDANRFEY